jgi:hypothetical protein
VALIEPTRAINIHLSFASRAASKPLAAAAVIFAKATAQQIWWSAGSKNAVRKLISGGFSWGDGGHLSGPTEKLLIKTATKCITFDTPAKKIKSASEIDSMLHGITLTRRSVWYNHRNFNTKMFKNICKEASCCEARVKRAKDICI